ncbi:MAG: hypothetical protein E6Q97_02585 [Desulfurellales bacterium]|nr:MAG: hypothetical protein E6Q97_02585 [Desulfurellales bacterium]
MIGDWIDDVFAKTTITVGNLVKWLLDVADDRSRNYLTCSTSRQQGLFPSGQPTDDLWFPDTGTDAVVLDIGGESVGLADSSPVVAERTVDDSAGAAAGGPDRLCANCSCEEFLHTQENWRLGEPPCQGCDHGCLKFEQPLGEYLDPKLLAHNPIYAQIQDEFNEGGAR